MDSYSAAFADLLVDQNDRRIDDRPGIQRPSLAVIENHLLSEAAANPALVGWQNFRPNDDIQADAMEGMCRGQSHRRNMAARGRPAAPQFTPPRPQPLSQRPAQPVKLKVTAEEKPRARRTAEQPLYVAKPASKSTHPTGGLMASKWAPQASGLATNLTGWTPPRAGVAPAVVKVTRMEAKAPTVFRERPKRPPVRSVPETSNAPSANIGRPVAGTTLATVKVAPAKAAPAKAAPAPVAPAKAAPAKDAPAKAAPAKDAPAKDAPAKVVVPSPRKSTPIAPSSIPKTAGIIEIRCAGHENGSFYVGRYMAEAAIQMLKANAIKTEDIQADQDVWRVNGGF